MYIYIHVYIHICTYIYIHIYMYTYIYNCGVLINGTYPPKNAEIALCPNTRVVKCKCTFHTRRTSAIIELLVQ